MLQIQSYRVPEMCQTDHEFAEKSSKIVSLGALVRIVAPPRLHGHLNEKS
jgi:hypothetical protein